MGHDDRGPGALFRDLGQKLEDLCRVGGVEAARGLVAEEEPGPPHDRARDRDALSFAAGKRPRERGRAAEKAHAVENLARDVPALLFSRPGEEERQRHVFLGRELGKKMMELEHESHARAAHGRARGRRERGPVRAVERHAARVGHVEPGEEVEQRRLSAARRAGDGEKIARFDGE